VEEPRVTVIQQLLDYQRFDVLFLAPEHHQYNDLELGQRNRFVAKKHGSLDRQFTQGRTQKTGRLKRSDETQAVTAQLALLLTR